MASTDLDTDKSFIEGDTVNRKAVRAKPQPILQPEDKKYEKPKDDFTENDAKKLILRAVKGIAGAVVTPDGLVPSGKGGWVCNLILKNLDKSFDTYAGTRAVFNNFEIQYGTTVESLHEQLLEITKIQQMDM